MARALGQFQVGDQVRFRYEGEEHWGRVTRRVPRGLRIKGADGRGYTTTTGRGRRIRANDLRHAAFGVFVLDTYLDRSLYSERQAADFWQSYCQAAEWSYGYERVHSLADLQYFLGRRRIREEVIVLSGHGHRDRGFKLTNGERIDVNTQLLVHPSNRHKVYLLSACQLGANSELCLTLLQKLSARAVVAYSRDIRDDHCFIAEPYLLQLMASQVEVGEAVEQVGEMLTALGGGKGAARFPLHAYLP